MPDDKKIREGDRVRDRLFGDATVRRLIVGGKMAVINPDKYCPQTVWTKGLEKID